MKTKKEIREGMEETIMKNGYIGDFRGWRIDGKSYDTEGNEIAVQHDKECFCCRDDLFERAE